MKTHCHERILIIEDELTMRKVLGDCLSRHGYRIIHAENGEVGLERVLKEKPDLVLMDVMMPRIDGFSLCHELRRRQVTLPILMLTAKGGIEDRVRGLDIGADDYLVKPFNRDELLARIRALLRRGERNKFVQTELSLGDVRIDFRRQLAWRKGRPLGMSSKEFGMLKLLLERRGQPVSRENFLDLVWGYGAFPTTRTVDKHMVSLRQKIEVDPAHPRWLLTVHGKGYRLEEESHLEVTIPEQSQDG